MPKANSDNPFENFIISISNAVKLDPQIFLKPGNPEHNANRGWTASKQRGIRRITVPYQTGSEEFLAEFKLRKFIKQN